MFVKNKKKNWGRGIPKYNDSDLMTKYELYDFALEVICGVLSQDGYKIIQPNPNMDSLPSIVAEKNQQLFFVVVEADVAPQEPKISNLRKYNAIAHAKKFSARCLYASVSFGSIDSDRFEKSIALKGDGYYSKFVDFENLELDFTIGTDDYKYNILNIIGESYKTYEIKFADFLSDDCVWYSSFGDNYHNGKKEVMDYYRNKFEKVKNSNSKVEYCVCCYDGPKSKLINAKYNDEIIKTLLFQMDKKPLLFLVQTLNGEKSGMIIDCTFNENGLISRIELLDHERYNIKY